MRQVEVTHLAIKPGSQQRSGEQVGVDARGSPTLDESTVLQTPVAKEATDVVRLGFALAILHRIEQAQPRKPVALLEEEAVANLSCGPAMHWDALGADKITRQDVRLAGGTIHVHWRMPSINSADTRGDTGYDELLEPKWLRKHVVSLSDIMKS